MVWKIGVCAVHDDIIGYSFIKVVLKHLMIKLANQNQQKQQEKRVKNMKKGKKGKKGRGEFKEKTQE